MEKHENIKICVFAGTTEGRKLAEYLSTQPAHLTVCVATEYGEILLPSSGNVKILTGRLSQEEMQHLLEEQKFSLVIDATHPYAKEATEHIAGACQGTKTEYLRLLREAFYSSFDAGETDGTVFVPDVEHAVAYLKETKGTILLTSGSKELEKWKQLPHFSERVYARVLPAEASLLACKEAGLLPSHLIAMQGPFSEEMNLALLHMCSASWLVTKDGGKAGGFLEKEKAAKKAGAGFLVIGRPEQKEGCSYAETMAYLEEHFGFARKRQVRIVGIGPGSRNGMTQEALEAVRQADVLIGAERMRKSAVLAAGAAFFSLSQYDAIVPEKIADYIFSHPEYARFTVVMSGDTGFYSGTKKLLPLLSGCEVTVFPGISSLVYLCARQKTSYEDVVTVSVHGRRESIVPKVRANRRVFVLSGGEDGVNRLCRQLTEAGLGEARVTVGERLSYPEEKITVGTARKLQEGRYDSLSAVLIEQEKLDTVVTHGLPDALFQRGSGMDGVVPMTKQEVRAVALSKLALTKDAVCWDIGAGTGSVAIEMALQAEEGEVYAIEKKPEATVLLEENKTRFFVENLTIVSGTAPEACSRLPAPTHVFIGGSGGHMREIIRLVLEKNPQARITAAAISLESAAELTSCLTELPELSAEVVSVQIARDKKAGPYHLMTGQNPIYLFTMQKGEPK